MNIPKISPVAIKANNLKAQGRANVFQNASDSIAFSGDATKTSSKVAKRIAITATTALMTILTACGASKQYGKIEIPTPELRTPAPVQEETELTTEELQNYIDYKEAQNDGVTVTLDLSENNRYINLKPENKYMTISNEDDKNAVKTVEGLLGNYKDIKQEDMEAIETTAKEIAQKNPRIIDEISKVTGINYYGDSQNIPIETLLKTDITGATYDETSTVTNPGTAYAVFCPDVNLLVEKSEKKQESDKTKLFNNAVFIAKNADVNTNAATLEITKKDIEGKTDEEIEKLLNNKIADAYGVVTMASYAGDMFLASLPNYKENANIFERTNEKNAMKAMIKYVKENDGMTVYLPKISVNIIDTKQDKTGTITRILTQERDERATLCYVTNSEPVINISRFEPNEEGQIVISPLDTLESIKMPDGQSVRQLYESDNKKYAGFACAMFRQIVDKDNRLYQLYEDKTITEKDLNTEIVFDANEAYADGYEYINLETCMVVIPHAEEAKTAPVRVVYYTPAPAPAPTPAPASTSTPTRKPTGTPTPWPIHTEPAKPTQGPTDAPTDAPPTKAPTDAPPTATPTKAPPTATPTKVPPTATPTKVPPTATPTAVSTTRPAPDGTVTNPDLPNDDNTLPKDDKNKGNSSKDNCSELPNQNLGSSSLGDDDLDVLE